MAKVKVKAKHEQLDRYRNFLTRWQIYLVLKKLLPTLIVKFSPSITLSLDESGESYTDGKHINLSLEPEFLDDRYTEKEWLLLMRALEGHECQHINSTPIHFMYDIQKWYGKYMQDNYDIPSVIGAKLGATWLNILEDGRIEQIAATHHPGLKIPLQYMNVEMFRNAKLTKADLDGKGREYTAFRNQALCYAKLGYSISGFKDLAGTEMAKQFDKISGLIDKAVNDRTCSDCYATTREVLTILAPYFAKLLEADAALAKLLQDMAIAVSGSSGDGDDEQNDGDPQKGVRRQPQPGNSQSGSGEGSQGEGDGSQDGQDSTGSGGGGQSGKDKDGKDGEGEGGKDGSGAGKDGKDKDKSGDKDGSGSGSGKGKDGKDGKDSGEDGKDGKGDKDGKGKSKSKSGKDQGEGSNDAGDKNGQPGEGKANRSPSRASGRCMDHDTTTDPGTYGEVIPELNDTTLPYSEAELNAAIEKSASNVSAGIQAKSKEPPKNGLTDKEAEELCKEYEDKGDYESTSFREYYSDAMAAPLPPDTMAKARILHRRLLQILRAKRQEVRNQHKGQLDVRSLWKVGCGDKAVMMRRGRPITADCAVFELVDNSGSMGGDKFKRARLVGGALEVALHGLSSLKISLFCTRDAFGHDGCKHFTVKDFDQVGPSDKSIAFGSITNEQITAGGGNKDGYSIRVATKELLKRPEKKKVLVVISDGEPTDYTGGTIAGKRDVQRAVNEARKQGIVVIALLIGSRHDIEEMRSRHMEMYGKSLISCAPEQMLSEFEKLFTQLIKQS